jgi:hypothetical protein
VSPVRRMSLSDIMRLVRYDANLHDDEGVRVPWQPTLQNSAQGEMGKHAAENFSAATG